MKSLFTWGWLIGSAVLGCSLSGCGTADKIYDEKALRSLADQSYSSRNYKVAAKRYFELWTQYPSSNSDALLSSAKAYLKADRYKEAIAMLNDYLVMRGDANGAVYKWKAIAYAGMAKTPLKDLEQAYNARVNLIEYSKHVQDDPEVAEVSDSMIKILAAGKMVEADLALRSTVPSFLAAMNSAREVIESYPDTQYAKYCREIYDNCLVNLGQDLDGAAVK